MIKQKIIAAYEAMAESYNEKIDYKPHNAFYDRPNTLSLVPEFQGKKFLDAACGPGKYAEIIIEQGGEVTGFDLSPSMVEYAKARNPEKGTFFLHDLAKPLDQIENQTFDVVICALAMHYIEDWNLTVQEFNRVLKPNGYLVISIEHPFFEFNFHKSTKYFEIELTKCTWNGFGKPIEVNNFRRPLQECIMPLVNNGFYIDKLLEPKPIKEFEKYDARHYKELNEFPGFMCIRAVKSNN